MQIVSREQAALVLSTLKSMDGRLKAHISQRDEAVRLAQLSEAAAIESLSAQRAELAAELETWARANRKAEFGEGQTLTLGSSGALVFRRGQRSLEPFGHGTWKKIVAAILGKGWPKAVQSILGGDRQYIRVKAELDKAAILRESQGPGARLCAEGLRRLGVKVVQEETFHVEPAAEPLPALTLNP